MKVKDRIESQLAVARKMKGEAGDGQDAWHDEGHKIGLVDEMLWSKRLREIQDIMSKAEIYDPVEQNEKVFLGVGVVVKYDDGSEFGFILEGYVTEMLYHLVSVSSPLGQAVLNANVGDRRTFSVGSRKVNITIKRIILPSMAEKELGIKLESEKLENIEKEDK